MEVVQARFGVVIIPTVSERVVLDNKLVRRVARQRLNRAITPGVVNIIADLGAEALYTDDNAKNPLGGQPDIPSGQINLPGKLF